MNPTFNNVIHMKLTGYFPRTLVICKTSQIDKDFMWMNLIYPLRKSNLLPDRMTVLEGMAECLYLANYWLGWCRMVSQNNAHLQNFANPQNLVSFPKTYKLWFLPFTQVELASRYDDNSKGHGLISVISSWLTWSWQVGFPEHFPSA